MRVAIVDDLEAERKLLHGMLDEYAKEKHVPLEIHEFALGINFVEDYDNPFDVVLMDVEMPLLNGMETAARLREMDPYAILIFVTQMAQYAIQGYAVDAMDYMVKPVSRTNLFFKIDKAVRIVRRQEKTFALKTPDGITVLSPSDVLYVEGSNQYTIYHTQSQELRVYGSLRNAEETMGEGFSRCSNSFIVNLGYVQRITDATVYVNDIPLPVSRAKKKEFLNSLNRYLGV